MIYSNTSNRTSVFSWKSIYWFSLRSKS